MLTPPPPLESRLPDTDRVPAGMLPFVSTERLMPPPRLPAPPAAVAAPPVAVRSPLLVRRPEFALRLMLPPTPPAQPAQPACASPPRGVRLPELRRLPVLLAFDGAAASTSPRAAICPAVKLMLFPELPSPPDESM